MPQKLTLDYKCRKTVKIYYICKCARCIGVDSERLVYLVGTSLDSLGILKRV